MKENSAGVIIVNKGNYLILHYAQGHWGLPKGHIEKGENLKETAKRETEEETGITKLNFVDGFEEKIHYFFTQNKKTISKDVIYLLATTNQTKVKLSHEHQDYKWLTFDKAVEQLTFEDVKAVLRKAQKVCQKLKYIL